MQKDELLRVCKMRPIDRVLNLVERVPASREPLREALGLYAGFLRDTASSTDKLEAQFRAKTSRAESFERARRFGVSMFEAVRLAADNTGTLRYLVI